MDAEKSAFVHLYIQWNSNFDPIYSDSTSGSETNSSSSESSDGEAEKDRLQQNSKSNQTASRAFEVGLSRDEDSGQASILKRQKTVGFETQLWKAGPSLVFDPSSPSFLAENLNGKKSSHNRFYAKSLRRDDLHSGTPDLSIGSRNNTLIRREEEPLDLQILESPWVGEVNWENVNWESKKPRRRRTKDEEPHSHRDFKLFKIPTTDRNTDRKHSQHHSHALRSYPEPTRRNRAFRLSRPQQEDVNDIYWEPPSHRPSLVPSISISGLAAKSNETAKLDGLNDASSESTAARRKGRQNKTRLNSKDTKNPLKSVPRSVSPGSSNRLVLPIFTWPTVSSPNALNKDLPIRNPHSQTNLTVPMSHDPADQPRSIIMDDQTLAIILTDAHDQLTNRKGKGHRHMYEDTTESTIQDVEAAIGSFEKEISGIREHENEIEAQKINIAMAEKKQILNQAKKLSDAFVPANYRCSITNKYWGAIHSVITAKV